MSHVVCLGLATLDTIASVPRHPGPDERVIATEHAVAGGGPAATAAVTLGRLGVPVYFVGAVGDDPAGEEIRAGLEREGVDVSELAVVAGARSPQSSILVSGGSRTIVAYRGSASVTLSERARRLCEDADWTHVDHVGYAAAPRARLSVDGGNPIDTLELTDVELYAPTEATLRDQFGSAEAALAAGARSVVVTRGEGGSAAFTQAGEHVEAPAFRPPALVSTLGAGDVFHGALLAMLHEGQTLADALAAANVAAGLSCRALDGRSAIPTRRELEKCLTTSR